MMELNLSEEVAQGLFAEAMSLGTTPEAVSAQVLAQHSTEWQMRQQLKNDRAEKIDAHIEYLKSRNPNYETTDPYAVDWQAVKAEGRRY